MDTFECNALDHNPPYHGSLKVGWYTHVCSVCGRKLTFKVWGSGKYKCVSLVPNG